MSAGPQLVGVELAGVDRPGRPGRAAGSSSRRSSAMDSTTPRAACGWRRRVPSNRRTSTSSAASRKRTRTRLRPELVERVERSASTSSTGAAPAPADHEGHPLDLGPGPSTSSDHLRDQRRRHVVDDEPAEVLEVAAGRGPPGAGHARHHQVLAHRPPLPTGRQAPSEPWACAAARTPTRPPRPATTIRPATPPGRRPARRSAPPNSSIRRASRRWAPGRGCRPARSRSSACPAASRWKVMAKRWASSRSRWSR